MDNEEVKISNVCMIIDSTLCT